MTGKRGLKMSEEKEAIKEAPRTPQIPQMPQMLNINDMMQKLISSGVLERLQKAELELYAHTNQHRDIYKKLLDMEKKIDALQKS